MMQTMHIDMHSSDKLIMQYAMHRDIKRYNLESTEYLDSIHYVVQNLYQYFTLRHLSYDETNSLQIQLLTKGISSIRH